MRPEQRRALDPVESGSTDRAGVRLAYDVFGDGPLTLLLMPAWSIVHSRMWKAQVPYLARHFRVVTFDGRGNGRSGRPQGASAYQDSEFAADTVAVLDATGTESAVLVSLSRGSSWSVHVAAGHPERVLGLFAISPSCNFDLPELAGQQPAWDARLPTSEGWAKYNRHHWLEGGFDDFREYFFAQMFNEPHSTKQIEDAMRWSADVTPETLCDTTAGRLGLDGATAEPLEPLCAEVRCPVAVMHGSEDTVSPPAVGRRLAELTGGSFTLLAGAGHAPIARHPVLVNRLVRTFAERFRPTGPVPAYVVWTAAASRPRRVLYLSSPIGLGHARRDIAIAQELRERCPDVRVDWLAQDPVTRVLAAEGERIHPASGALLNESAHIEQECGEHDLHAFQAIRRMDEVLVNNFMVFHALVEAEPYDLVVGDEAWDVDYFLHENPELKRFPFAWLTDFVGWLPMPSGGDPEAELTADHNVEMLEQRARFPWVRDRSIFVGNPDDVVPDRFGSGLPRIRDWTRQHFEFSGYVTGFTPPDSEARAVLRRRLGYGPEDKLCIVTVGGSGVGAPLLRRVLTAVPLARRLLPELHFLVVTGPRIDHRSLPRPRGTRLRGYLPHLHDHLAAADVAVVQGGLTTCMELTAAGTPFLYVPLENHFEQNFHVRRRLARYDAGRHLSYAEACDPDLLAESIVKELSLPTRFRPVETDGAARVAGMLADLL